MMGEPGTSWMARSLRWQPGRLITVSTAVGLAVVGAVLMWAALARPATPDSAVARVPDSSSSTPLGSPKPSPGRSTGHANQTDVRDRITGPVLPESHPLTVSIGRIGVRSTLVDLGLDPKGAMEVPPPARAGWFTRGPTPGALGPAVIAGHVTWNGSPAVFYRLGALRPGDQVSVARKDGRTAVFSVTRVARFSKSRFPTEAVYGAIDHAGLRLITCGGTYDAARHRYLDNVVVFAKLDAVHESRG
jgi:Sortase domain